MQNLEGFLGKIYPAVQKRIEEVEKKVSIEEMKKLASERALPLVDAKERLTSLSLSLVRSGNRISSPFQGEVRRGFAVIAEIKRASPSAGAISDRNILNQVQAYVDGGAVAISVLTESSYFNGSIGDLTDLKIAFPFIPFSRKDFIISEYQVYESKAAGADMLLLITRWLEDRELKKLYELTRRLSMHALVEVENEEDFKRAFSMGVEIIGINARNLVDLSVDVHRVTRLARWARAFVGANSVRPMLVGESGIDSVETVRVWYEAGIDAVLVGEALMKAEDPEEMVRKFSLASLSS